MFVRSDMFMITCAARTGSTMLVKLLRCHPSLLVHGEVWGDRILEDPAVGKEISRERFTRPEKVLYKYFLHSPGKKAVGFKLKYDEMTQPRWHEVRGLVERDLDLKNPVPAPEEPARALRLPPGGDEADWSDQRQDRRGDPAGDAIQGGRPGPPRRRGRNPAAHRRVQSSFAGRRVIKTTYERLVRAPHAESELLFTFLGVDTAPVAMGTEKIVRAPVQDVVINFSEVERALHDHGCLAV